MSEELVNAVKSAMRDVPDFPKPGILFKDITPILADGALFQRITAHFAEAWRDRKPDVIVGMESRGFIFGCPLAHALDIGFVPARKPGKLPYETIGVEYALEYGTNRLELHTDAVSPGQRVLIVDDLLATGGTAKATVELVQKLGGEVIGCAFLVELGFLDGRKLLDVPVESVVTY